MEISRLENLPPPPGIINSIRAGFDSIASHITAIFLPLLLNLFLWLGPRLRMNELFDEALNTLTTNWQALGIKVDDVQRIVDFYNDFFSTFNLFWILRTLPIGTSSLLPFREASSTPFGEPTVWQVSGLSFPFLVMGLVFLGWVSGAIYFRSVAQIATPSEKEDIHIANAILQTIFISILCGILFMTFAPVLGFILTFTLQQGRFVSSLVILFLSFTSMWFIVPIFFLPHAVFVFQQNVFKAVTSSINLTRFTLPNSSMFVLTIFILAYGLNFLWSIPSQDSWLTVVGIFGHSFVTTALLASSFIYYRDMSVWAVTVLEKLKPTTTKQA